MRVIDSKYRILASSVLDHQKTMVGQKSTDDVVKRAIVSQTSPPVIYFNKKTGNRVLKRTSPIMNGSEVIGALYVESNIEKVFKQIDEINRILAGAAAVSLTITIIIGIFIAQTFTRPISDMRRQAQAMAKVTTHGKSVYTEMMKWAS